MATVKVNFTSSPREARLLRESVQVHIDKLEADYQGASHAEKVMIGTKLGELKALKEEM